MNMEESVLNRRSVRSFLPKPVSRDVITGIMEKARWAPSWGNTQPWEIVVADGAKARELAVAFENEGKKGTPPRPDIPVPTDFPEIFRNRYICLGRDLLTYMGIERDDKEARKQHYLNMYRFFGAPAVIYLLIDQEMNIPYSCLDIGSIGTTICYLALKEGLGTIYLAASMHFPDIVRRVLSIPESKKLVIGIAIGYPHPTDKASLFRSHRAPVDEFLRFAE
jgi:nitroreductase